MGLEVMKRPLSDDEIEWRVGQCGMGQNGKIWAIIVPYISARTGMERLDEAVGPMNWKDEYDIIGEDVFCRISVRLDQTTNEWVTKVDGASKTKVEAFKGGLSDAFKRCVVKWGLGRELYNKQEVWAIITDNKSDNRGVFKDDNGRKHYFNWKAPSISNRDEDYQEPENEKDYEKEPQITIMATNDDLKYNESLRNFIKEAGFKFNFDKSTWTARMAVSLANELIPIFKEKNIKLTKVS